MREKGQTEVAKTLETPVFSRGIEILTEKKELPIYHVKRHKALAVRIAELKAQAADFDPVELYKARQVIRPAQEKAGEQQLEDALQKKPSFSLVLNAKQETSRLLKEDTEERQVRQMLIRRQRSDPQKPKHFQR